jgi:hypothetical protein
MVVTSQVHRLFTHEDRHIMHMHKTLGALVLGHIFYRMNLIIKLGDSGLSTSPWTPFWMMIHSLLHTSSFQFRLPEKRNRTYNIIWPEFRLHSMIFAYRSILSVLLMWMGGYWNHALRGPLVLGTMVAADAVSKWYAQDTTMRANPYPPGTSQEFILWHNRFYSVSQFGATMGIMFRGTDSAFLALLPIQTAPFLMTLVKKGILNQAEWHVWYTVALLTNWIHALFGQGNDGNTVSTIAYQAILWSAVAARLHYRVNKYAIWGGVWALKCVLAWVK